MRALLELETLEDKAASQVSLHTGPSWPRCWYLHCVQVKSDWCGIIDAWAARFLDEMDYKKEAANTLQFKKGEWEWHGQQDPSLGEGLLPLLAW